MTSLIDVVFLLLLFFMLTSTFSHFARTEIAPPQEGRGAGTGSRAIIVRPTADGWLVNGQTVDNARIAEVLNAYREKGAERILLNAGAELDTQRFVEALGELQALRFEIAISR